MPFGPSGRRRWRLYDSSRCRREEKAMARRRVQFRSDMRPDFRPNDGDLGYALRWFFGSREEMNEIFRDFEVRLVKGIYEAAGQPMPARDGEGSIPPEGDLPTADRPVQLAVKAK